VARVVAFIPDLLFGSRVQADLSAGGNEVELLGEGTAARDALAGPGTAVTSGSTVLVADLTDEAFRGAELVESLSADGLLEGVRTLAFYSHVDVDARRRAESAGFGLIVARSRMAREGAELVSKLALGQVGEGS
jgi:hypothetical protein